MPGGSAAFFDGNVLVTGDITLPNADCAEDFDIAGSERIEAGTVMVLGDAEGALVACSRAYDRRVAGVISGAGDFRPGLVLDKHRTPGGNRQPVALMGKVFCKVDAAFGAIEVGDLLTSSPTPGHAMKDERSVAGLWRGDRQGTAPPPRGAGLDPDPHRAAIAMTTLVQAVTRSREDGQFVADGPVRVGQLQAQFPHAMRASMRDLIDAMRARASVAHPFAVIFCRFKGDDPHPDEARWEAFYREAFMPGTGGFVDFWRDASLGKVDVSGTQFFGWIDGGHRARRCGLRRQAAPWRGAGHTHRPHQQGHPAVQAAGGDPITGFFNQISLYMFGKTQDGVPIDGSADENGKINMTAPFFGDITAHEMGHSLHMQHDADVTGDTKYHDPCCVMSQGGPFSQKPWNVNFGCPVCLPHLMIQKWMYTRRMLRLCRRSLGVPREHGEHSGGVACELDPSDVAGSRPVIDGRAQVILPVLGVLDHDVGQLGQRLVQGVPYRMGLQLRQPEPDITPAEVDFRVEAVGGGEQVFDLCRAGDDRLRAASAPDELPLAVAHPFEQRWELCASLGHRPCLHVGTSRFVGPA